MANDEEGNDSHSLQSATASSSGSPKSSLLRRYRAVLLVIVRPYGFDVTEKCLLNILLGPIRIHSSFSECPPKAPSSFFVPGGPHRASDVDPQFAELFTRPASPSFVEVLELIWGWRIWNRILPVGPAQHQEGMSPNISLRFIDEGGGRGRAYSRVIPSTGDLSSSLYAIEGGGVDTRVYEDPRIRRIPVSSPRNVGEFSGGFHIVLCFDGAFVLPAIPIPEDL